MCSRHRKALHLSFRTLFTRNDSTPLPHFKTAAFYRTADSVVIWRRLNVSLGVDPSCLHHMTEAAARGVRGAGLLATCNRASDGICVFGEACPAKKYYMLNGNSLVRGPLQLHRQQSRNKIGRAHV